MSLERRLVGLAVFTVMVTAVCSAQSITSARSGTLHYFEGDVSIDGVALHSKASKFPEIKDQGILRTGLGRAEILLTPGVFLRVAENSSIRMMDTRLASTRVDILSGSVMVEADDPRMSVKDSPVTLLYKDYEIRMVKHGLMELSTEPAQMKVFKGEAEVTGAGNRAVVKDDHLLTFNAALTSEKFDAKTGDELYLWTRNRSENLSAANMSSARSISDGGAGFAGGGGGNWNGGWYFNPYFDMYTFVPMNGTTWSPFGFGFFSPASIYSYYAPTGYWYGGGGARGTSGIGQPLSTVGSSGRLASPLAQMRGGNASQTQLGSPMRSETGFASPIGGANIGASGGGSPVGGFSGGGGGASAGGGGTAGGVHTGGGPRGR